MIWVIKAGGKADGPYDGETEYLHAWSFIRAGDVDSDSVVWTTNQALAHRFDDRNHAARMCNAFPIEAYSDDVRLVKLVPCSTPAQPGKVTP